MLTRVIIGTLVFLFSFQSHAQTKPTEEHVRELLKVTGAGKLGEQMMDNMIATYKKSISGMMDEFWEGFRKEANADTLINMIIPVYQKYYTDEDVVQLIAFYNTELGKKVVKVLPGITQGSYDVGAAWGKTLGEKLVRRILESKAVREE